MQNFKNMFYVLTGGAVVALVLMAAMMNDLTAPELND